MHKGTDFLYVACLIYILFSGQKIYVTAEIDGRQILLADVRAKKGTPVTIQFTHSVQKTPVIEELESDGKNLVLLRTKYKSQGVGLPFMESDGKFREEDGYFIMDDMNRIFEELSLRTGVGTNLIVTVGDREIKLYKIFVPGTKINIVPASLAYKLKLWR